MRITVWFYRRLGWGVARVLLYPIVGYFFLTDARGRRASLRYLSRLYATPGGADALGSAPGIRHVFRHYFEFGVTILDRVGFWMGDRDDFDLTIRGMDELQRIAAEKSGALILGSHLGSFDAMRLVAEDQSPIAVHVLMYTRHAARINDVFQKLDALRERRGVRVRVVSIEPAGVGHVLEARKCVERGEVIALLADRVPPSESQRVSQVKFLGDTATLPQGPILLGGLLGCPVLLMTGIRTGRRRYEIRVERFADRIELARKRRAESVTEYCQAYADRLAAQCVRAPYQFFNFYDLWREGESLPEPLPPAESRRADPSGPGARK
jgi:predicted LPLAT superfamily acyltransferase